MSKLWTLSTRQWIKGLLIAVVPAIIPFIQGIEPMDMAKILSATITAALTYLVASLSQDENNKFLGKY